MKKMIIMNQLRMVENERKKNDDITDRFIDCIDARYSNGSQDSSFVIGAGGCDGSGGDRIPDKISGYRCIV